MEVTQRFQPAQDTTFQLLEEIEVQGAELEQVVTTVEKQLEGPVNEEVLYKFIV
jgi:hypothetical protein